MKQKNKKKDFLVEFLSNNKYIRCSLLGDLFIGKGVYRAGKGKGKGINKAAEEVLRAGYGNNNSKVDF